jgi:hypothetical protein
MRGCHTNPTPSPQLALEICRCSRSLGLLYGTFLHAFWPILFGPMLLFYPQSDKAPHVNSGGVQSDAPFPLGPKLLVNAIARVWIAYGSTPYGSGLIHCSSHIFTFFFVIFTSNLVPSCVLDFSMSCRSSLVVLINRITMLPKSKFTFAPFQLYPKTLSNSVSPNGCVSVVLLHFFVLDFKFIYLFLSSLIWFLCLVQVSLKNWTYPARCS